MKTFQTIMKKTSFNNEGVAPFKKRNKSQIHKLSFWATLSLEEIQKWRNFFLVIWTSQSKRLRRAKFGCEERNMTRKQRYAPLIEVYEGSHTSDKQSFLIAINSKAMS